MEIKKLNIEIKRYPAGVTLQHEQELIKHGINPWVARALLLRSVIDPQIALSKYKIKHYSTLKGMKSIAFNLANAIENKDKITIVADYDCDGATSCAIGLTGLQKMGANIDFVVPNRFEHGYGLSPKVIDMLIETKGKPVWILTVDNGIASHEGVDYANKQGIKVLVTDHHLPVTGKENPKAVAIVNPNQEGDTSGLGNMAGCGVIYYTLAAVREELSNRGYFTTENPAPNLAEWLDLVALGTIADVVKLDDNNRWLVRQGLNRIKQGKVRDGMRALFYIAGKDIAEATSQDFGFALGPRLNAAGRLKDMTVGIRCLVSENYDEALELAKQLDDLNIERKTIEKDMREIAWQTIDIELQNNNLTKVVYGKDFHEGVIGIVAGRIKENTNCPTIVFADAEEEGCIKGSGRSVPTVHLRDALDIVYKANPDIFKGFGGHAMAAGLTIKKEYLQEFKKLFEEAVNGILDGKPYQRIIEVDGDLRASDISINTALIINNEVWGQGFLEPIWYGDFHIVDAKMMGKEEDHIKLKVMKDGQYFDAVQFFNKKLPVVGETITLIYRIGVNDFRGQVTPQIMIIDKTEYID